MELVQIEENENCEWRAGTILPTGLDSELVTPEVEDARRRFILSLRAMTARQERQERDAAAIRQWMHTLEADVAAYKAVRLKKRRRKLLVWTVLALIIFGANLPILHGFRDYWWIIFFVSAGGSAAVSAADSRRSKEMARLLATSRDPRAVSVLAVAARDGESDTQRVAEQGLRSILPQLQASDSEHITDDAHNALIHLLGHNPDPDLKIAILHALEQVGDERAMSLVSMLAETESNPRVADAARNCLPFLKARASQARLRHTLLRPVTLMVEPDKTLLRPAGATETSSDQLLRPAD